MAMRAEQCVGARGRNPRARPGGRARRGRHDRRVRQGEALDDEGWRSIQLECLQGQPGSDDRLWRLLDEEGDALDEPDCPASGFKAPGHGMAHSSRKVSLQPYAQ